MWQDEALCAESDVELYFDKYEESDDIAIKIDNMCMNCPVVRECFMYGVESESWGVWGGIYLVDGNPDRVRNSHKTKEVWRQVYEAISDN